MTFVQSLLNLTVDRWGKILALSLPLQIWNLYFPPPGYTKIGEDGNNSALYISFPTAVFSDIADSAGSVGSWSCKIGNYGWKNRLGKTTNR